MASKLLLIAILWLGGTYAFEAINNLNLIPYLVTTDVSADGNINIWWPTQNVTISNTQAFKAVVQEKNVNEYDIFWLVDGGQLNKMSDSSTDYPHKEASVDVSKWTWHGNGPYKVTFRAIDKGGTPLGESSVDISTPAPAQGPTVIEAGSSSPAPTTQTQVASQPVTTVAAVAQTVVQNEPVAPAPNLTNKNVNVWWPTNGATLQGSQPFKAVVDGVTLDNYKLYWQVDNGNLNEMPTVNTSNPHKEVVVDLSRWTWRGSGPYVINFVAKDAAGSTFAKSANVSITIGATRTTTTPVASTAPTPTVQPVQQPQQPTSINNPFAGQKLFINYKSDARKQADAWRTSRPADAAQIDKIAQSPDVVWLGNWISDISKEVKARLAEIKEQGALPVFIAYNIPNRDCGQHSAGGVSDTGAYRSWIQKIADAIGTNKAVVVLEPDGLTLTDCLSSSQKTDRYNAIKDSVNILKSKGNISVYIDAGHPGWITASEMANRLNQAGVSQANGFALNISNFFTTGDNISYGQDISNRIAGKHFIIDTGRNGVGPAANNEWCNPWGRALGIRPTANTGNSLVDAYLWIKGPGGSDGYCNGGPAAGTWWADYALDMAKRSIF